MTDFDPKAFENAIIDDMRSNAGRVTSGPLAGHPILILTSKGAKTDEPRRALLTFSRDGGDFVVAGSAGGSPTDPGWVRNVEVNPKVSLEAEDRRFEGIATVVDGKERDRLWEQHVEALPHFAEYPKTAGRVIPIIRITPKLAA